ncbi:MAG: transposase [Mesorhizobium sp.]|nr:MAG: transposase [Mesorhizobium sp.]
MSILQASGAFCIGRARASKKTILPAEQLRPKLARRRAQWIRYQTRIDPTRLVFLDETWVKTNMAPLRGWGARGERLVAHAPYGHWKTMTFIAALRHDRVEAPWVLNGPINGEAFRLYVETQLIKTLKPGDIVVLDNLGSHRALPSAISSEPLAQGCSSCRRTVPISIQSSSCSPSSSTSCAALPGAVPKPFTTQSPQPSMPSRHWNAETTSKTPATSQPKCERL